MKYMLTFEYDYEDFDEWVKLQRQFQEEREKYPDKYPKKIFDQIGYLLFSKVGKVWKGFILYEVENEEQMINHTLFWQSVYHMTWIPIVSQVNMLEPRIEFGLIKDEKSP